MNIFLLEDDNDLAAGIIFLLEREGNTVTHSSTIKQATEIISKNEFDFYLIDVLLPDGNGLKFCRLLKESCSSPVIFLSSVDEEEVICDALDIGADDYITKPFFPRQLLARINSVFRRYHSSLPVIIKGNITLDLRRSKVFKDGKPLNLSPGEYRLLSILMQNAGQIVTKDRLIAELWEIKTSLLDENTLAVNIRRLREKIEADPNKPIRILTVRGAGYQFIG